jgi:hypothetical protein
VDGLAFATLPKALIPFHRDGEASWTPFEEQLEEALATVPSASGPTRVHFTVSSDARDLFREALAAALRARPGIAFDVGFSEQSPATDTLAADSENRPFRDASGALVFRPGGHGALLANLQATAGDVVLVKNIDNVQHRSRRETTLLWKKLLTGFLLRAERQRKDHHRPLRVCGVVRNEGEPGGGPFWVRGHDGRATLQIVEASEVDLSSPEQKAILSAATHFNPVDLVCLLRDPSRRPYDLGSFVNPSAVFFAKKSKDGRELKALERPGLWNGGMAEWETHFVEVPAETFSPVKTILDLLRPAHQPAR